MKKSVIVLFFSALASLGALAQNVQQGINDLYAERYQSAKSTFEKLLAANPNNIEASYWLGQTYIANNDVSGAKSVYDKALASSNNAPLILAGEGHVELLQGKTADARQHFESAINASRGKKGNDPNILNAVGRAITESYSEDNKTDLDYAIAKLTEASQLAPTNQDIWLNLGNAYRKKRDGGNAVQAYIKAGNFAPALYRTGYLYESQRTLRQPNDWDIVLDNYNKAVAADPRFAPAYLRLYTYYLYGKQDFATAESFANKYVSSSDPGVENTYLQAQTKFVQNQFNEAINLGKNIIAQTNNNPRPRVYRLLTYSYMGIKDTATACTYANQFFEKEKNEDEIVAGDYMMHAMACGKGNDEIILADINKAVQKDPQTAARNLREFLDDARKSGNKLLTGNLSLILYGLQGANANPQNLVGIGVDLYQGGNLSKADSVFQAYSKASPDSIYGYYWDARLKAQQDSTMSQGLAVPQYDQVLRIAAMDTARSFYKGVGVQAAGYLTGYYNNVKGDKATALSYIDKGLAIDPANTTLQNYKKVLSSSRQASTQQKNSTSNNAAKDGDTKTKAGDTKTKTTPTKTKTKTGN
jgi:tetratricopeptide (TPR) repeat protein